MSEDFFNTLKTSQRVSRIDSRLHPEELLFVVYVLDDELVKLALTVDQMSVHYESLVVGIVDDSVFVNGNRLSQGVHEVDGYRLLVLDTAKVETTFFVVDPDEFLSVENDETASIRVGGDSRVVVREGQALISARDGFVFFNDQRLAPGDLFCRFNIGDIVLTGEYLLERRPEQWKITLFTKDVVFSLDGLLPQEPVLEFPPGFPEYRRSPRVNLEPPTGKFRVLKHKTTQTRSSNSVWKMILPPVGMVAVGVVTSLLSGRNPLMMAGMSLLSVVTAVFSVTQYFKDKKVSRQQEVRGSGDYEQYLADVSAEIGGLYRKETEVLGYKFPSPRVLCEMLLKYDSRIYERMTINKDFLEVSLGTGMQPSSLVVDSDVQPLDRDAAALRVQDMVDDFSVQRNAPVTMSVRDQCLGLVGTYDVLKSVVANLLLQVAFFHSYRDVNFIALVPEKTYREDWFDWRVLKHFKIREVNLRGLVHNAQTRDMVLNSFYQILNKRKQILKEAGREKPQFSPHYVLTILDDSYLSGHGINEFLAEDMSELGVTVIWGKEDQKLLPETVTGLVSYRGDSVGEIINDHQVHIAKQFTPYVLPDRLELGLSYLANLIHVEVEKNSIPETVGFLELYGVREVSEIDVANNWAIADTSKTLAVPLGLRGRDDIVELNLHERAHGPHGLVAGTTGSGKSEIIQSYILSLACNFAPEDVGFLPIDFKGGGMANLFQNLPHLLGSITNLDGAGTARALASIRAELQKRQRLFGRYGVNHINGYTKLYKQGKQEPGNKELPSEPLPHLFLISDEFAELKSNQPEFMDELVSTARIGRSLGVHLILATQKPSGVVSDQIWSNSRFKLALKVADTSDSNEVLKTPDAASIVEPGRAYLQVGNNEIYELFQSAWSGADYLPDKSEAKQVDERVYLINDFGQWVLWSKDLSSDTEVTEANIEKVTELDAVVDYIAEVAKHQHAVLPAKPWLPPLEDRATTPVVKQSKKRDLSVPLGILDIPAKQAQEVYNFSLEEAGHTVIFSSPGYGKSTLLQTLVMNLSRKNNPEQVQFNLLDFGNNGLLPLKDLPHVADIVQLEEDEKLTKMLARIQATLAERKSLFKDAGVATLRQYQAKTGVEFPTIINLVDNYDALAQSKRREEIDEVFIQILREGAALGMYLILTAGRFNAIRMNMISNLHTKIALYLNDDGDLSTLFGRDRLPQSNLPGRGQLIYEGTPVASQVFLPTKGDTDTEILENLTHEVEQLDEAWTGSRPEAIPMVPETLTLEAFQQYLPETRDPDMIYLGLNKQTATLETFQLFQGHTLGVFYENPKQRGLVISHLLDQILANDEPVKVVIDTRNLLAGYKDQVNTYIDRADLKTRFKLLATAMEGFQTNEIDEKFLVIFDGVEAIFSKLGYNQDDIAGFLQQGNPNIQFILIDAAANVGGKYSAATTAVRENVYQILFGGSLQQQNLIPNLPLEVAKQATARNVLHSIKDDELANIVIPAGAEDGE